MAEPEKPILTEEQEQDIGIIQNVINTVSTNVLAILVLAPVAYMAIERIPIPEAYWAIVGAVITYYFKK